MGNKTAKSKKLVGFVATATLATSMMAGASNANAQTTDSLKVNEPIQATAEDKKEKLVENQAPVLTVQEHITIYVDNIFVPMLGVSAFDKEDGDITSKVKADGKVDTFKPGTYELTYTVTDSKGLKVTAKQTVTVKERMEPTLTVPYKATINVGDKFDPMAGVSAIDKEDGDITTKVKVDGKVDTSKAGTYELTYTVINSKGLKVTEKQTVTVKEKEGTKNEAPVLTVPEFNTLHVGDTFDPMLGVSAFDKEDGDLTSKVSYAGEVDTSKPGRYIIVYGVTDSQGENTINVRNVYVVENEETPDMEPKLTVPAKTTINVGDSFDPMAEVSAIDPEDGDITSKVKVDGKVDTSKAGTYVLTYTVTDSISHKVTAKQTVTVKEKEETKNEMPVLTVPFTTTLHVGDTFDPMKGVKAFDKEDGDLTSKVKHKGNVDTSKPGKYIVEYGVVDSQGVNATATQTVIVEENGETPDMEPKLTVPVGATINVGDKFDPMAGVSAIDKEDGDITSKVKVDGKVDTSKAGTYELTYTVTDSKGHKVTEKQTVTVKEKEESKGEAPVLTVPAEVTMNVGVKFDPMSGVKAIDKEDGDITDKVIHFGEVDTSKVGTYEVKFLVRDSDGNESTMTQKVVVKDKDNGNGSDNGNNNTNNGNGSDNGNNNTNNGSGSDNGNNNTNNGSGSDNGNNNTNNGSGSDNGNNNTNNGNGSDNGNSNSSNNSTSDKKEDTYKQLPKTGASSNNSTALGVLMVLTGMVITFGRKFKKALK
ncbi:immunoglobulin-like domain-containing protein [Bacillus bingmayongensis]|uniref:immunoglobulin-like domain-containing protein n=1 Tax=Bacillus bingmayongensis TaxID=1150157 RepID=UPI0002D8014E|nr:immunoglobulin-like domain-containing protein [Bacillus bingmayongensis]